MLKKSILSLSLILTFSLSQYPSIVYSFESKKIYPSSEEKTIVSSKEVMNKETSYLLKDPLFSTEFVLTEPTFMLNSYPLFLTDPYAPCQSDTLEENINSPLETGPQRGSNPFIEQAEQQEAFQDMLRSFLNKHSLDSLEAADNLSYHICRFSEDQFIFSPPDASGFPIILLNTHEQAKHIVEIPHPYFEANTLEQGLHAFSHHDAKAVLISTRHKCASNEATQCRGLSSACSVDESREPFKVSDVAHNDNSLFHKAHVIFSDAFSDELVIQLHGARAEGVIISNGTKEDTTLTSPITELYRLLEETFPQTRLRTCNAAPGIIADDIHCAVVNTQSKHLNEADIDGELNACRGITRNSTDRFIHIEQSRNFRNEHSVDLIELLFIL